MGSSHMLKGRETRLRLVPGFGLLDLEDPGLGERLAAIGADHLVGFAHHMREGLLTASVAIGLEVLGELMAGECTAKAGPKGKHDPGRAALRHGSDSGKVRLGGRLVAVSLPESERDALVLHVWEGLSYDEIAHALAVPIGTVRSRLNRSRRRIRELADSSGREQDEHPDRQAPGRITS